MLYVVDGHSRDEVHAALTEEVYTEEDQERAAFEHACCLREAFSESRSDRLLLLLPCAEEYGYRYDKEQRSEDESALQVESRLVGRIDDHSRHQAADHSSKSREDHARVGELGAHPVIIHHVRKESVIRHAQHGECRVEQAVHDHVVRVFRHHRRCADASPYEDEHNAGCEASDQNVEPLGPESGARPLSYVAHDRVSYSIPYLSDHRDGARESGIHSQRVSEKYNEECVDDNKASSSEYLTHTVGQPVE